MSDREQDRARLVEAMARGVAPELWEDQPPDLEHWMRNAIERTRAGLRQRQELALAGAAREGFRWTAPQPIATAPRSGRFLVYGGECSCDQRPEDTWPNDGWCVVEREGEDFNVVNIAHYGVRIIGATHWMPEPGRPE